MAVQVQGQGDTVRRVETVKMWEGVSGQKVKMGSRRANVYLAGK